MLAPAHEPRQEAQNSTASRPLANRSPGRCTKIAFVNGDTGRVEAVAVTAEQTLRVARDERGVVTVTLDRPEVRNALNPGLVADLTAVAVELARDETVRVVVLTGSGEVFCAGADLAWVTADEPSDERLAGARRLARLLRRLHDLGKPLVARVNGPAFGGGAGLLAVCDLAVAVDDAVFAFSEVRLGLAPAVISPYVVRAIGRSQARALFVSGERFDAERAERIGLVHRRVARADLDAVTYAAVDACLLGAPRAQAHAKALVDAALGALDEREIATAEQFAAMRAGEEARAGIAAFEQRRPAPWVR